MICTLLSLEVNIQNQEDTADPWTVLLRYWYFTKDKVKDAVRPSWKYKYVFLQVKLFLGGTLPNTFH